MAKAGIVQPKRRRRTNDPRTLRKFLEELTWVLSTYSDIDYQAILKHFDTLPLRSKKGVIAFPDHVPKNPNIHYLIGILPGVLRDDKIFPTNEDLSEFAVTVLGVGIPRWSKKSKFELIGHILCQAVDLDDAKLEILAQALSKLAAGDKRAKVLMERKKVQRLDWNIIIQRLTST